MFWKNNPLSGNLYLQRKDEIYISLISAISVENKTKLV